jgi:hypothetical protein
MSAQFFKILSGVLVFHLALVNIIWVGFSAPLPRPPATFTYEGVLPAEDSGDVWPKAKIGGRVDVDHFKASYFNHWIQLRDPSRSLTHDRLGF